MLALIVSYFSVCLVGDWVWEDLSNITRLDQIGQAELVSSVCPSGCRFDRSSQGDIRYLRVEGDESVLFETFRPGVVTRIWMTQGEGISQPLDVDMDLRIYIDHVLVVDMPLVDFFAGQTAPFLNPLVGNRERSSGGNYAYVPIQFQGHCRISLTNALDRRIWYQIGWKALPEVDKSFTMSSSFASWTDVLSDPPHDPFSKSGSWQLQKLSIMPAGNDQIEYQAADQLTGLMLEDAEQLRKCWISIQTDDDLAVEMRIEDYFGCREEGVECVQSLMIGRDDLSRLYSFWPMPHQRSIRISIDDRDHVLSQSLSVDLHTRFAGVPDHPSAGLFRALKSERQATVPGTGFTVIDSQGRGVWVGQFLELSSPIGSLSILEGDERIWVDDLSSPQQEGTGVEDFFNGGFYFRSQAGLPQPFALALHGLGYYHEPNAVVGMIRLMISDSVSFSSNLRVHLEAGPTENLSMNARSVNYFYMSPEPDLTGKVWGDGCAQAISWWDETTQQSYLVDSDANGVVSESEAIAVTGEILIQQASDSAQLACYSAAKKLNLRQYQGVELDVASFPNLVSLKIDNAPWLTNLVAAPTLAELEIRDAPQLTTVPTLTNLERLHLSELPLLEAFNLDGYSNLVQIVLMRLGLLECDLSALPNLRSMKVINCNQLATVNLAELPSLQWVRLQELSSLTTTLLQSMPSLTQLDLMQLPVLELMNLFDLPQLRQLQMTDLPALPTLDLSQIPLTQVEGRDVGLISLGLPVTGSLKLLRLRGVRISNLNLNSQPHLKYADLSVGSLSQLSLPSALQVLVAPDNRLSLSPDLASQLNLEVLDLTHNELTELTGIVANPTLGLAAEDAILLTRNRLRLACPEIIELLDRQSSSSSMLQLNPQRWDFTAWPFVDVLTLVLDPDVLIDCSD